jgi:hypothetical protein
MNGIIEAIESKGHIVVTRDALKAKDSAKASQNTIHDNLS